MARVSFLKALLPALAIGWTAAAGAQAYPTQNVRIVVPFPPGGGIDILIRAVAAELSPKWGKPVIIENKAGAGSMIGAEAVARAEPDGHTLLATVNPTMTANRFLYKSLPYDPDKSFTPVTLMVQSEQYLVAHSSVKANDLRELVALAKREKGKLNFGSYAPGSQPHLLYGLLSKREGLDLVHIPYKGIAPVMLAVSTGEVQLTAGSSSVAGAMMKDGRIRPLALAGKKRSAQFPNVATTIEQGYPYLQAPIWYALFAPAKTPPAVIAKINADVAAILKAPAFAEKQVTSRGLDVVAGSPQELAQVIREEVEVTAEMIKAVGIQPE
jgi:tripartite-type tricarboxylate transporter receptor subunit TctC